MYLTHLQTVHYQCKMFILNVLQKGQRQQTEFLIVSHTIWLNGMVSHVCMLNMKGDEGEG